ncbi:XamI family restriction endonuclease [Mycolicibacterium sp. D5.8-2]|uniref:XamI family restriction endonuclease n=1 Tax=Mycolicibacterium sp. D5.8-2 TaxID=3085903 RepID=UPI00298C6CFF|nr:XamI family restriction endonuclease [Mycolicibacterium sp. D5.8-2]MDW5610438.1 XamI family restriction endonuclease [Mycolicibacterium sp. D5.8-2]
MTPVPPPRWTEEEFAADAGIARANFVETRMQEPLEQYLDRFEEFRQTVEELIEGTVDLTQLADQAVELLTRSPDMLTSIRYLASPPISADDLTELADTRLSTRQLSADEGAAARRVIETVMLGLDRNRFPWVSEDREPTDAERTAGVISTAALIATQKVRTARSMESSGEQEEQIAAYLVSQGFTQVATRTVSNMNDAPAPGEFCRESMFGTRKADLIVRLWDGRVMPIECKVSGSSTNSVKRLNNDAAVKATVWLAEFGSLGVVPTAALSGVFKVHNLESAQNKGLTIIWAHKLDALGTFIEATKGT